MQDIDEKEESLFEAPPMGEQERMIEAVLFASSEPVTLRELAARMPHGSDPAEALVYLRKRYEGRGVRVVKVGDAWAMRTATRPREWRSTHSWAILMLSRLPSNNSHSRSLEQCAWASAKEVYSVIKGMRQT